MLFKKKREVPNYGGDIFDYNLFKPYFPDIDTYVNRKHISNNKNSKTFCIKQVPAVLKFYPYHKNRKLKTNYVGRIEILRKSSPYIVMDCEKQDSIINDSAIYIFTQIKFAMEPLQTLETFCKILQDIKTGSNLEWQNSIHSEKAAINKYIELFNFIIRFFRKICRFDCFPFIAMDANIIGVEGERLWIKKELENHYTVNVLKNEKLWEENKITIYPEAEKLRIALRSAGITKDIFNRLLELRPTPSRYPITDEQRINSGLETAEQYYLVKVEHKLPFPGKLTNDRSRVFTLDAQLQAYSVILDVESFSFEIGRVDVQY